MVWSSAGDARFLLNLEGEVLEDHVNAVGECSVVFVLGHGPKRSVLSARQMGRITILVRLVFLHDRKDRIVKAVLTGREGELKKDTRRAVKAFGCVPTILDRAGEPLCPSPLSVAIGGFLPFRILFYQEICPRCSAENYQNLVLMSYGVQLA